MRVASLLGVGLLMVAAACSPVKIGGDANLQDADDDMMDGTAGIDATIDATAFGAVTVVVYDTVTGDPVNGAKVVFSNPDGSTITTTLTDEDGVASGDVPLGASVTAAYTRMSDGNQRKHLLQTVFGLVPGDNIELGPIVPEPTGEDIGSISLMSPGSVAGAGSYTAGTVCNQTTLTATAPALYYHRNDRCTRGRVPLDLLGIAWDATSGDIPLAYSWFVNLDPADTTTKTGTPWTEDFNHLDVTANNSPFAGSLDLRVRLLREGIDYDFTRNHDDIPITSGGSGGYVALFPPVFTQKLQLMIQIRNQAADQMRMYYRNLAPTENSFIFNLGDRMLPGLGGVTVADGDLSRPGLTWTYDESFGGTVGGLGAIIWIENLDEWDWQFLVPPDARPPFQLPFMPGDILDAWPIPNTATLASYIAGYLAGGGFGNWDEFRQHRGLGIMGQDDVILPPDAPPGAEAFVTAGGLFDFN